MGRVSAGAPHSPCSVFRKTFLASMWISGLALAVLLFWAVGAYNRLMRLRSAAVRAFGKMEAHLVRELALVAEFEAARRGARDASAQAAHDHATLVAAAEQLAASLAVSRQRPLDPEAAAALAEGARIVDTAWATFARATKDGDETLSPFLQQREQLTAQRGRAQQQFNAAVVNYNEAVTQFPASVLARIFGFRKAQVL